MTTDACDLPAPSSLSQHKRKCSPSNDEATDVELSSVQLVHPMKKNKTAAEHSDSFQQLPAVPALSAQSPCSVTLASSSCEATSPSSLRCSQAMPTYQLSTTHRSFYPTGLHRYVPSAIVRYGDVTHTWRKLFGALMSVVCVREQKYLIGVQVAALLNRETFNMYRSMKIKHIQTARAKSDHIEFLARAGAVRGGTHSVTLIPFDACMYFIADARELAQRASIVGDIKGRRVRPTPLRSFLATKPRIHRRKPLPWNVRRSIKRQEEDPDATLAEETTTQSSLSCAASLPYTPNRSVSAPKASAQVQDKATTALVRSATPDQLHMRGDGSSSDELATSGFYTSWSDASANDSNRSSGSSSSNHPGSLNTASGTTKNTLLKNALLSTAFNSALLELSPPNTTLSQRELLKRSSSSLSFAPPSHPAMMVDTSESPVLRTSERSMTLLSSPTEPLPPTYEASSFM
eukprot:CAMPEP_0174229584 /NCGR_PEP_ID=MMETSP0417-20130205/508_1 /TAXON_ID=242541 /ORGANISM="Mayorella sp, Strain BSH-02190019" /LENGTH=460 /DNA_ID=CAMNT_0015307145 /DNA_START=317 /DNA_END=1699 /DNA_ORIENTATION=-